MSLPRTRKFRSIPSAGKVMSMLFWDYDGPTLEHYQQRGKMVNSAQYCAMPEEEMKPLFAVNAEEH
jgi:hypothetical protein